LYFKDRPKFLEELRKSIKALIRKADKEGLIPVIRINGTSDLPGIARQMAREFPDVQLYDFTKVKKPWTRTLPNYHLTFSRSEINDADCIEALEHGINVAVVFEVKKGQPLPPKFWGHPVIDGDLHDLRFLDKLEGEGPFIVGLRAKGKARGKGKYNESGFVVKTQPLTQIQPIQKQVDHLEQTASAKKSKPKVAHYSDDMFEEAPEYEY
jgi:hypothetical protein